MTRVIQIVFALMVIVCGLAFHIKNDAPVPLNLYVGIWEFPLSWIVVAAFSFGALLGVVVMFGTILRLRFENRRLAHKHEIAAKEIVNLRAIPINDVP